MCRLNSIKVCNMFYEGNKYECMKIIVHWLKFQILTLEFLFFFPSFSLINSVNPNRLIKGKYYGDRE